MYSIYYGNARWWEQFVNNSIIPEMNDRHGATVLSDYHLTEYPNIGPKIGF